MIIANDGYVDFDDIIQNGTVTCHTNKTDCCHSGITERGQQLGNWYYPNRTVVESYTVNTGRNISEFFARSRSQSVVRLFTTGTYGLRTFRGPLERGRFYCAVPDANNVLQTVYVNIRTYKILAIINCMR